MKTTAEWLLEWEGCEQFAYKCSQGVLTIGVGRAIEKGKGPGISKDEALFLLENDIKRVVSSLTAEYPWFAGLSSNRKTAVISMGFQLGIAGFSKFKNAISALEAQKWSDAVVHLKDSQWYTQTPARAEQVCRLILLDD